MLRIRGARVRPPASHESISTRHWLDRRGAAAGLLIGLLTLLLLGLGALGPAGRAWLRAPRRAPSAPAVAGGDTVVIYGPRRFAGSNGPGQTYIERFAVPAAGGRWYTLHLVNGTPAGGQRASRVTVRLNGIEVLGPNDVTKNVAQLDRRVAVTGRDTLVVTVAGTGSPVLTLSLLSTSDPEYNVFGPNQYAIPSGLSTSFSESFPRAATAAAPYRVYVVNGSGSGLQRVIGGSITLNGTQIVNTVELATSLGTLTKAVTLAASNTLGITLNGLPNSFITVRFTAIDTTAPVLTITTPAPGTVTRQTSLAVSGTISDETSTTVTVNGTAATVTNNTSYTVTMPLSTEGSNLFTIVATDAGGRHTDSTRTVTRDTQAPALTLTAPADSTYTRAAMLTVTGTVTDATAVTVNANGTPLTLSGSGFTGSVPLPYGSTTLMTTATDAAGNTASLARLVVRDTLAPALAVSTPVEGATVTGDSVTVSGTVSDASPVTVAANGRALAVAGNGSFSGRVPVGSGSTPIAVTATDRATNATTVTRTVTRQDQQLPPDPSTVAPPVDRTVATTVGSSTAFLYTGPTPIQTGVASGTIQPVRAAVIRGKVLDRAGAALPGATIAVLNHPEFGQTLSRADGMFDLAVNGGGRLTVNYAKSGFLPSQRQVEVPWQDYAVADDVVLVPLDPAVTTIDFSQPIQVARGSSVTDDDGTRRATLLFAQGTQATMALPNGTTQPLNTLHVRATEYTVGANGDQTMPAALPPTSAYTYAVELGVDEATASGATQVSFSKPVAFYAENFLEFPVGLRVPAGFYSRGQGVWVPDNDGRIVKILSVSDGKAVLDVDGTNQPADSSVLDSMGITAAERTQLATLYQPGVSLLREALSHFSTIDLNFPKGRPGDAQGPTTTPKSGDDNVDDPCEQQPNIHRSNSSNSANTACLRTSRSPRASPAMEARRCRQAKGPRP